MQNLGHAETEMRKGAGGGGGEGRLGSALFSFHVESGFLRDGSSICQGIGPLVIFSNNVLEINFLWGRAGVDEFIVNMLMVLRSLRWKGRRWWLWG